MPELPEVEVVRAGLEPAFVGARIDAVQIFDPRSLKRHDARRGDFAGLLTGATVISAERRGKFMWFPLDSGEALVTHLGMSGQVLLRAADAPADRHLRIQLQVTHPEHGGLAINFVDQRIFGSMAVDELVQQSVGAAGESRLVPSQAAHIALDPLDSAFDDAAWVTKLRSRSVGIKRALLDQNLISGIGNIYADESLWAARLHFDKPANTITKAKALELLAEVRAVLSKALSEGGTSFDAQYVNVNGASGYFAHSLNAYGQQGKPCARCGAEMKRVSFMNRGSHFCPRCQRK